MQPADTLVAARWIVPVTPPGTVLEDHALVVVEGKIADLLPHEEATKRYRASEEVSLDSHALIPGLVNAHTHAAMTLFRGLADDVDLQTWLQEHIWPAETRWIDDAFVRDGTRLAAAEMLRGGTTCFNDMYFYPEVAGQVASDAGMRACVGLIALDFPTGWAEGPDRYLEKGVEVHERFRDDPLVTSAWAPHSPYTVSDGSARSPKIWTYRSTSTCTRPLTKYRARSPRTANGPSIGSNDSASSNPASSRCT